MSVPKKAVINNQTTKKALKAKSVQVSSLKAKALAAHSMKKKRAPVTLHTMKAKAPTTDSFSFGAS